MTGFDNEFWTSDSNPNLTNEPSPQTTFYSRKEIVYDFQRQTNSDLAPGPPVKGDALSALMDVSERFMQKGGTPFSAVVRDFAALSSFAPMNFPFVVEFFKENGNRSFQVC